MKRLNPWFLGALLLLLPLTACLSGTEVDGGAASGDVLNDDANGNADTNGTGDPDTTTGGPPDTTTTPTDTAGNASVLARINVPTDTTDHPAVRKIAIEMNSSIASDPVVRDTITLQAFVMELSYPEPIQIQETYELKALRSWNIIGKALDATDATVYTATTSVDDILIGESPQFVLTFE